MDDSWADYADGWDDEPGTRAYAQAAFESLGSVLEAAGIDLHGSRVVDFGCGTGLLTECLVAAEARVTAVDTSPPMLAILRTKAERRGWTSVSTTTDLGDVHGGQDVIVCSSVCSFVDDYPATAAKLAGLLRPGGLLVQWDWEDNGDGHGLTREQVAQALGDAGLERIEVATAFEVETGDETMQPLVGHGVRPTQ